MEKLQKCVNFILTVPVFFATSCISFLIQFRQLCRVTDEKPLMLYLAYFLSDLNK
jgi:hypothetical protein